MKVRDIILAQKLRADIISKIFAFIILRFNNLVDVSFFLKKVLINDIIYIYFF